MTKEQWSPAQIVGWLRRQGKESVCIETVYAYIRADKENGGGLWNTAAISSSTASVRYPPRMSRYRTAR